MEVVAATFRRTSKSRQVHSLSGARPFGRAPFLFAGRRCPVDLSEFDAVAEMRDLTMALFDYAGQPQDETED